MHVFFSSDRRILLLALLVATSLLSGCRTSAGVFPENYAEFTEPSIVTGQFLSARYLDEFPWCAADYQAPDDEIIICMDPPPLALRFRIDQVLYGAPRDGIITVYTTDHFGRLSYRDRLGRAYLVNLVSDGTSFIMPRYQNEPVSEDIDGHPIVAVWDAFNIPWLPCAGADLRVEYDIAAIGRSAGQPLDGQDAESLDYYYKDYYFMDKNQFYPKYAIPLPSLRAFLKDIPPADFAARCVPPEE
jgi:hypothetical protein